MHAPQGPAPAVPAKPVVLARKNSIVKGLAPRVGAAGEPAAKRAKKGVAWGPQLAAGRGRPTAWSERSCCAAFCPPRLPNGQPLCGHAKRTQRRRRPAWAASTCKRCRSSGHGPWTGAPAAAGHSLNSGVAPGTFPPCRYAAGLAACFVLCTLPHCAARSRAVRNLVAGWVAMALCHVFGVGFDFSSSLALASYQACAGGLRRGAAQQQTRGIRG